MNGVVMQKERSQQPPILMTDNDGERVKRAECMQSGRMVDCVARHLDQKNQNICDNEKRDRRGVTQLMLTSRRSDCCESWIRKFALS